MRYERARYFKFGWVYTELTDEGVFTIGYCLQRCTGHNTREEAERHFYEWQLDNVLIGMIKSRRKCERCYNIAMYAMFVKNDESTTHLFCDVHTNIESFAKKHKFHAGREVIIGA